MLLRWVVTQAVRVAAEKGVVQAVSQFGPTTSNDPAQPPMAEEVPPCDVAFIFPLAVESDALANRLEQSKTTKCATFLEHAGTLEGRRVVVANSGIGAAATARATADVIAIHRPSWVIAAGFAAALKDDVRRGHVVMPSQVVDGSRELEIGLKIDPDSAAATGGLHVGRLLCVSEMLRSEQEKRVLGEEHDALAYDMETIEVAAVCRQNKTRFLAVRLVTDSLRDQLPKEMETLVQQKSFAGKLGAATGAIFKRPSAVKDMWKLKEDAIRASDKLAGFLVGVLPSLCADAP